MKPNMLKPEQYERLGVIHNQLRPDDTLTAQDPTKKNPFLRNVGTLAKSSQVDTWRSIMRLLG